MNSVPRIQPIAPQQDGWNFNGSHTNESALKPICQEVQKQFALPARRLYRYFAVEDDVYLAGLMGAHFRGFHIPLSGRNVLPEYLREYFFRPYDEFDVSMAFEEIVAFDNLIYIRYDTCSDTVGCVITYAHELQHFIQHGHTPRLSAVNSALYHNLGRFDPTATPIDIPQEREANLVSKRVAEKVCGGKAVRKYAKEQIRFMERVKEPVQAARWVFFRDVSSSTDYDMLAATLPFVQKYKGQIDFGIDLDQPNWWLGPLPQNLL
jgi:hypothetical protein